MKRFKAFLMSLVLVTCIFGTNATASASTNGVAYIPVYYYAQNSGTVIYLSNISDQPRTIIITLYDSYGNMVHDDAISTTGLLTGSSDFSTYDDSYPVGSIYCTLDAHSTGRFHVNELFTANVEGYGYGKITYNRSDGDANSLIAWGTGYTCRSTYNEYAFPIEINGGLPF